MKMQVSADNGKPIDKWSNRDFVIYYSDRLVLNTGRRLEIPGKAWVGFMSRVKTFRANTKITPTEYKQFIDDAFDKFFQLDGYTPSFNAIVSPKVLGIVTSLRKKKVTTRQDMYNNNDFLALREQLYADITMFQKGT